MIDVKLGDLVEVLVGEEFNPVTKVSREVWKRGMIVVVKHGKGAHFVVEYLDLDEEKEFVRETIPFVKPKHKWQKVQEVGQT